MTPKFGTSGLRGLVTDLTPELVADHVRAFLAACPTGDGVFVGRDLRASSPRIAETVMAAVRATGHGTTDCGAVPTPALARAAMAAGQAAIMVTGSHIPADRNGLKFYRPDGEITKADEAAIIRMLGRSAADTPASGPVPDTRVLDVAETYCTRYVAAFGPDALSGLRLGVYQHSSVARDLLMQVLAALGATPVALARSDRFVPIDTEALPPQTCKDLARWCQDHALDAVVSTDGDADRPLVMQATGRIVPGDVLGVLTARTLGADTLCVPVSANSMVSQLPDMRRTLLTRIGSPYVLAGMQQAALEDPKARIVGFEPNGGFLLGFPAQGPTGALAPLMTRDSLLPIVAPLAAARAAGCGLEDLIAALPARFTAADRLQNIPPEQAQAFIETLTQEPAARQAFFDAGAAETGLDLTDGLRVRFANDSVVHLRPSGNAPECRVYAEAETDARATALVAHHLARLSARLSPQS